MRNLSSIIHLVDDILFLNLRPKILGSSAVFKIWISAPEY